MIAVLLAACSSPTSIEGGVPDATMDAIADGTTDATIDATMDAIADATFGDGNPGMALFIRPGGTPKNYCYTQFSAGSL